jgi:hypothetical protein
MNRQERILKQTYRHELIVNRYYRSALKELQILIPVCHRSRKLKIELSKKRPRYFRKSIWNEAIAKAVEYTKTHKNNFVDGRLVA